MALSLFKKLSEGTKSARKYFKKLIKRGISPFIRFGKFLVNFIKKIKTELIDLLLLLLSIFVYGLLFNITFHYLFGLPFGLGQLIGLGFSTYFIKEEFPSIIRNCFPRRDN
jgi:hypothetical protein